jgi:tRNA (uracil-5-)-methyltransferase TRM9
MARWLLRCCTTCPEQTCGSGCWKMCALLQPGGCFVHSEWQFQHSPKLMAAASRGRRLGCRMRMWKKGDTLLDWRYALPGQPEQVGLRYVHLFDREELARLAAETGFEIIDEFESDGEGGRLGSILRILACK